jgi:hypothetical protein
MNVEVATATADIYARFSVWPVPVSVPYARKQFAVYGVATAAQALVNKDCQVLKTYSYVTAVILALQKYPAGATCSDTDGGTSQSATQFGCGGSLAFNSAAASTRLDNLASPGDATTTCCSNVSAAC